MQAGESTPNDWRISIIEPSSGLTPSESISPDRKVRRFVGTVAMNPLNSEGQTNQVMNTDANENEFMLISAIKKQ